CWEKNVLRNRPWRAPTVPANSVTAKASFHDRRFVFLVAGGCYTSTATPRNPEPMSKTFVQRRSLWTGLGWFVAAVGVFGSAVVLQSWSSLCALLCADALCLLAIARSTGLRRGTGTALDAEIALTYLVTLAA